MGETVSGPNWINKLESCKVAQTVLILLNSRNLCKLL